MLKQIGFGLICLMGACITPANAAMTNHALQPGITLEYDLPPQEGQMFVNYMFWSISAKCKITTEDDSNDLFVEVMARKGKVNDVPLSEGQSINLTVRHGDVLNLTADSGAKVKITNYGLHMIKATCST